MNFAPRVYLINWFPDFDRDFYRLYWGQVNTDDKHM